MHRSLFAASLLLMAPMVALADDGDEWSSAGGNLQNTRNQISGSSITVANAGKLSVKWVFNTVGDVTATPSVDGDSVYVPDWAGYLYAVNRTNGALRWAVHLPTITGVPGDMSRATPAIAGDKLFVGTLGSVDLGLGGKLLAINKNTGKLVWSTQVESHPRAIIIQSATVFAGRVYVGVASQEEALAATPGYQLSFRGSVAALAADTGDVIWKTYTAPTGYTGAAVWGSSPAVDPKRRLLYVATGNNYSIPAGVLACAKAAGAVLPTCLSPDDHFDSVLALDLSTGAVRWATRAISYDVWNFNCIPGNGNSADCPIPEGPDYDFAQAPALYKLGRPKGGQVEFVGVGQKSGQYWALDPDSGAVRWITPAGPGGGVGGLQWGSAVDGDRVYVADANSGGTSWTPLGSSMPTTRGAWSALDAASGALLWQTADPNPPAGIGGGPSGPVTTTNGVVFGCSLDASGNMYAMNGATGEILWNYPSGGSCLSGAAIAHNMLFWGSGDGQFGIGTHNNKLLAFGLPD